MFAHTGRVFEIYSIGDGLYMQRILNALAAISNDGLLLQLVAFGLLLGLLVMGVKNVINGGMKMEIGTLFASFLLGVFLFGMRADVVVIDMSYVPGQKVQGDFAVANLPFGIAAMGSLISTVGFTLTEQMEQGFSVPEMANMGMSRGGFGKMLEWVNSVRLWERPAAENTGSRELTKFKHNLNAYLLECTLPAVEMGHIQLAGVRAAEFPLSVHDQGSGGIGYNSNYLMVQFIVNPTATGGATYTTYTCAEGHAQLEAQKELGVGGFYEMLGQIFPESGGPDSAEDTLAAAYQSIGVSTGQVGEIVLANAVNASLDNAMRSYEHRISLSKMSELMIEQASQQRLVQWAAEETMFRRIMRPMMSFFEALMYALSPFMALAVGLGTFGITTVFRYMMLSIWVSLWMPVLAIIQLFQITSVQHVVTALQLPMAGSTALPVTSIAGAELIRSEALEWMATGAALAAWTPAITMALVFSGAITASALAGKMQGQDTINEKMAAPDVVNSPPAIQRGSLGESSQGGGSHMAGIDQPTISFGQALKAHEAVSEARSESASASRVQSKMESYGNNFSDQQMSELSRTLSRVGGTSDGQSGRVFSGEQADHQNRGESSTGASIDKGRVESGESSLGIGGSAGDVLSGLGKGKGGSKGAMLSGALGLFKFGNSATTTDRTGASQSAGYGETTSTADGASGGYSVERLRSAIQRLEAAHQVGLKEGASWTNTAAQMIQDLKAEQATATRSTGHEQRSEASQHITTGQSLKVGTFVQQGARAVSGDGSADMRRLASNMMSQVNATGASAAFERGRVDARGMGFSGDEATAVAASLALSGHYDHAVGSNSGMASLQDRQAALVNAMSGGFAGGASPSQGFQPPASGRSLASGVPDPGTARESMGPDPRTDRVNPSQIEQRRQSANPGAAAGATSPEAASGHALNPSEVASGGVVSPTVQGGGAAMAQVQADGIDARASSAEANLNSNAPPEAASPAFIEKTGESNMDKLRSFLGLGPDMPPGGGGGGIGGDSPGPSVSIKRDWKDNSQQAWDTIPMLPPDAGREEFDGRLAAVQQQLPNSSEAVQTAVAAADMHSSKVQMGANVANQVDAQLGQLSHEEWDQVKQFTDLRSGDQHVKIESLRQGADNIREAGQDGPDWRAGPREN